MRKVVAVTFLFLLFAMAGCKDKKEYVRRFPLTVIEATTETETETETTKDKQGRKKGEKRVQVSVYLKPNIYKGIKIMAGNMDATISDILEVFAGKFVERNHDAIQEMETAWDKVKSTVIIG